MKQNIRARLLTVIGVLAVLWGALFLTDYSRCQTLRQPLFVVEKGESLDGGGSGIYQGLGYTVSVRRGTGAGGRACIQSVEMRLLGKVISASIT